MSVTVVTPNVRIISDGTPEGTKVLVDGREMQNVTHVSWECGVHGLAIARVTMYADEVVLDGQAQFRHQDEVVQPVFRIGDCVKFSVGEGMADRVGNIIAIRLSGTACDVLVPGVGEHVAFFDRDNVRHHKEPAGG